MCLFVNWSWTLLRNRARSKGNKENLCFFLSDVFFENYKITFVNKWERRRRRTRTSLAMLLLYTLWNRVSNHTNVCGTFKLTVYPFKSQLLYESQIWNNSSTLILSGYIVTKRFKPLGPRTNLLIYLCFALLQICTYIWPLKYS